MFVKNTTRLTAGLARADYGDVAVAALVVESVFRIGPTGKLDLLRDPPEPRPTDPPSSARDPLWTEVAVTATGDVLGPSKPPFTRVVAFTVGAQTRHLAVSGDRTWTRGLAGAGSLRPSEPARFDAMPLTFERAFGGSVTIEPGLDLVSGLPHPGGESPYPWNPLGRGFHLTERAALGAPLPNIEDPDERVARWDDRPRPAGISPCRELGALRLPRLPADAGPPSPEQTARIQGFFRRNAGAILMRLRNHAPPELLFADLPAGTPVRLEGVGRRTLAFEVPPPPARVVLRRGDAVSEVPARLRALHVDARSETVLAVYAHALRYRTDDPPHALRLALAA